MSPTRSILLAEEDDAVRVFLADNLVADGFEVLLAADKPAALAKLATRHPDLVVCDVNGDTLGLLDAVRSADGLASRVDPNTPLIILTGHRDALARVRYLERGGDDVLRKPFRYAELLARINAVLRRAYEPSPGRLLRVGTLHIDTTARAVRVGEAAVELAAKEYALLVHLARDPRKVFTKHELLRDVWGFRASGATRTLDAHAIRLRHKLSAAGGGSWIQNIWGVGYRLAPLDPLEPERSAA
jgi:DNA-binding response OmpR family regulator